jgi:hypothetical protein
MTKRCAQAWAFAAILLLPNYIDLTAGEGDARMHVPVPLTKIALAHLIDMALVAVLFFLVMALLRKLPQWTAVRWGLMALLPTLLLARNLDLIPFDVPSVAVLLVGLVGASVLMFLIVKAPRIAVQCSKIASAVLTGFAVFAMVTTFQLIRAALWKPGPQALTSTIPTADRAKPRLVWILFDELAYKPVFEARDPSLQLPSLDRLRSESTLYSNISPIAYRTTKVVPSLMLGHVVTDVAFTTDNHYMVKTRDDPNWRSFDGGATLLAAARQHGLSTSIVGWYIPYCPMFAGIVAECYWSNDDAQDRGPTLISASLAQNAWFPLQIVAEQAIASRRAWKDVARWNAEGHIESEEDLRQHALRAVATSQADILYLHLPAPHPPSFWSRQTHAFASGGSYLDSLDYTDRLLGQILARLETQPRWAATTLIVQGDHSWRTEMWRPLPGWSAEDERISHGGQWDPRPVLMIHEPGQQNAQTVTAPTSLMLVHDFVAAKIPILAR